MGPQSTEGEKSPTEVKCSIRKYYIEILRERPHNTYAFRGGQRFFMFHCKHIGICTVLRYEGGGGSKISKNCVRIMWTFPYEHIRFYGKLLVSSNGIT